MLRFGEKIVRHKVLILLIGIVMLIPCTIGYINTRVNYDLLSYLPEDIETMIGQNILKDEFGKGGFSFVIIEGMPDKDVEKVKEQLESVDHVAQVLWYDSIADISVPKEILPEKYYNFFNSEDSTMMIVFFDDTTSADGTLQAIDTMRKITSEQCFISGMSAITADMKHLSESETLMYAGVAVILTSLILAVTMDTFLIPLFFMLSIGLAIAWNLGTNFFFGEISFMTQALALVLQLGVTMDYSIFLWHSYKEQQKLYSDKNEAMARAISMTVGSVVSSSFTTVAGFLSMCFMSFTLGLDLGIVMAKGVIFGVIACVTVLPSMILIFDKAIEKTSHKDFIPEFHKTTKFIIQHFVLFFTLGLVILFPSLYGYNHYDVYYNLDSTMPAYLQSMTANEKLAEEYGMNSTHMLLASSDLDAKTVTEMMNEIKQIDGVQFTLSFNSIVGTAIPDEVIPENAKQKLKSGDWQLIMIGSEYKVASDEVNTQVEKLSSIARKYDNTSMLIGEAPATKDLIEITNHDFTVVSILSIAIIFVIIAFTFRSVTIPVILVAVIELAIMINLGLAYYLGDSLPFVASVVIGTIQLGATVDYAILMTTRYRVERHSGKNKQEAVGIALFTSMKSVMVSAFGFFSATIGVAVVSEIGMISSLCMLLARGALVSMVIVLTILPSMFLLLDKIICKTSVGFKPEKIR
ncbi:MAG: MMPL family transporter [Prevotella sp.]|nr:MMPL family transporter [Alistipes senegalensis]MCM1358016.1 MMPL family transporter [Prevotella sp.]MCM1473464.1 MMPL family transporter [Muribaculaceae bacterium]